MIVTCLSFAPSSGQLKIYTVLLKKPDSHRLKQD